MTMKRKAAGKAAKQPKAKARRPAPQSRGPLTLEALRSGKERLEPDDLIGFTERFGRLFRSSSRENDVYTRLLFGAVTDALRWAKARGYVIPMKEVLRDVGA